MTEYFQQLKPVVLAAAILLGYAVHHEDARAKATLDEPQFIATAVMMNNAHC